MDGSSSMVLAIQLEGVTSLAVDPISNMLFFAHGRKIEFMDINGKNRLVRRRLISQVILHKLSSIQQQNPHQQQHQPGALDRSLSKCHLLAR
jgi:hypothetical protein